MHKLNRAHSELLARLANLRPPTIVGAAGLAEVEARADHLRDVYQAVNAYLSVVSADTANHLAGLSRHNWDRVELVIWDAINEDDHADLGRQLEWAGYQFAPAHRAAA